MKKVTLLSTIILLIVASCDKPRIQEKQEQKKETPNALQEESSYEMVSKKRSDDLMESLYKELADKTPELKELETKIEDLSAGKSDSTELFDRYNGKNQSYYSSAESQINQINDTILRKKMKSLIASSLKRYNSKIVRHSELLKSIDKKTMSLNDLHNILIITTTLPFIEKYQNDNLPATKSLTGYSKQIDKVLYLENFLLEKENRKGKTE